MTPPVSESQFSMWRAVFAMAHADGVVTPDEQQFLEEYLDHIPFSDGQKARLRADLVTPQDIGSLYATISEPADRKQFFFFARMLVWSDGDFDAQERAILDRLKQAHIDAQSIDTRALSESASAASGLPTKASPGMRDFLLRLTQPERAQ